MRPRQPAATASCRRLIFSRIQRLPSAPFWSEGSPARNRETAVACAGGARVVLVPCVAHCAHEGVCHTVPPTATKRHPCGGQIRERKGARASLGGGTSDNTHAPPGADGTRLGAGCWWRWQGGTPPTQGRRPTADRDRGEGNRRSHHKIGDDGDAEGAQSGDAQASWLRFHHGPVLLRSGHKCLAGGSGTLCAVEGGVKGA